MRRKHIKKRQEGILKNFHIYNYNKIMETTELNIGMLRQHLNEHRITDPKKMVTSEEIKHWLEIEDEFLIKKEKNILLTNWLDK